VMVVLRFNKFNQFIGIMEITNITHARWDVTSECNQSINIGCFILVLYKYAIISVFLPAFRMPMKTSFEFFPPRTAKGKQFVICYTEDELLIKYN
jgi:hypothetical protein